VRSPVELLRQRASLQTKRRVANARLRARTLTSAQRVLPGALVIGAQRAGTSSLYRYLGAHPQVAASVRKETEYFTRRFDEGEAWYRSHFTLRRDRLAFEATPDYLFVPGVEERAHELLPHARLIVLLREPAARARSHHQHMTRLGYEYLPFAAALAAEDQRLGDSVDRLAAGGTLPDLRQLLRYSYGARGRYASQLERWLRAYPREALLVVRSEDLFASPAPVLHRIEAFLGLDPWLPPRFENHSLPSGGREQPPASTGEEYAALERLRAELAGEVARLEGLLDQAITWP
jgi:hypothetical protein